MRDSSHCPGKGQGGFGAGGELRLGLLGDLRLTLLDRQRGDLPLRLAGREVARDERDLGVVGRDVGLGRAIGGVPRIRQKLQRVEGRNLLGEAGRRERQSGGHMRIGARAHDLLLAGAGGGRRLEGLLGGDNVHRPQDAVALLGIDDLAVSFILAAELGAGRRLGEAGLMIERRIGGRADEQRAGEPGQHRAGEPADRDAPTVERRVALAVRLYGRLIANVGPVDLRQSGKEAPVGIEGH